MTPNEIKLTQDARVLAESIICDMASLMRTPSISRDAVKRVRVAMDNLTVVILQLDPEDE